MKLSDFFNKNPRIAIAFSGGVDSSYLLYAAKTAGCDVRAYFIKSQFQPEFELDDAARFADSLSVPLTVGTLDVLSKPDIAQNPPERCYYCKTAILSKLRELSRGDGFNVLCDGTNANDDENDRPGMRALRELGVISPLRDCGLTKAEIRRLSKQAGLTTYDKPSYACLATRIPTGTTITRELLEKIERAEGALSDMGFSDFRVRTLPLPHVAAAQMADDGKQGEIPDDRKRGDCSRDLQIKQEDISGASQTVARIQMPENQWNTAASRRAEILAALQPDFAAVVLDMVCRLSDI